MLHRGKARLGDRDSCGRSFPLPEAFISVRGERILIAKELIHFCGDDYVVFTIPREGQTRKAVIVEALMSRMYSTRVTILGGVRQNRIPGMVSSHTGNSILTYTPHT